MWELSLSLPFGQPAPSSRGSQYQSIDIPKKPGYTIPRKVGMGMNLAWCSLENQTGHEAGRALLADLYRRETGEALPEIRLTDRGKPCFPDRAYHFSISHTKRHAFCVLSEKNIGIDAEELDRKVNLSLGDKILSPEEKRQFDAAADKQKALLTFWVLKEAAAKLSGEGLRGYPSHTNFSLDDPRVMEIDGCLVAVITE